MHPLIKVSLIELNRMFEGAGLNHPLNVDKTKDVLSWIKGMNIELLINQDEIINWLNIHGWEPDHIRKFIHLAMEVEQKHGNSDDRSSNLSPEFFNGLMDKALAFNVYFYLSALQNILLAHTNQGNSYLKARKYVDDQIDFSFNELINKGYEVKYGQNDSEQLIPAFFKNSEMLECLITKSDTLRAEELIMNKIL